MTLILNDSVAVEVIAYDLGPEQTEVVVEESSVVELHDAEVEITVPIFETQTIDGVETQVIVGRAPKIVIEPQEVIVPVFTETTVTYRPILGLKSGVRIDVQVQCVEQFPALQQYVVYPAHPVHNCGPNGVRLYAETWEEFQNAAPVVGSSFDMFLEVREGPDYSQE